MPCLQELDSAPLTPPWMMTNGDVAQPPVLNRHWYIEPFFGVKVQMCPILRVMGLWVLFHRVRMAAAGRRLGKLKKPRGFKELAIRQIKRVCCEIKVHNG